MIAVKVSFEDHNHLISEMNCTLQEAEAYYLGKFFNFGDRFFGDPDNLVEAVKVEELTDDCSRNSTEA